MDPLLVGEIFNWGAPGVVILGLAWTLWKVVLRYDELQNKRVEETRETIAAINHNTTAINALTDLIKATIGRES